MSTSERGDPIPFALSAAADPVRAERARSVEPPRSVRRALPARRLAAIVFAGGLLLALASALSASAGDTLMVAFGIAALVTTVVSVRRHRPSKRWPWLAIAGALFLFLVDGVARVSLHTLGNLTASRSLVPDYVALPGYVLLGAGLFGFSAARGQGRQRHIGILLDGSIAALAIFSIAWVYVIGPELFHLSSPLDVRLVLTCYPAMSIFLVVVTLRIVFNSDQARVPAYWFLVIAMSALFLGDLVYALADNDLARIPPVALNLPYGIAYLAAGATAAHASMRYLTEPAPVARKTEPRSRIILVAAALLIPATLVLRPDERLRDRFTLTAVVLVLSIAATLRLAQAIRIAERSEATMAHQARHDILTGLPNRRMMHEYLASALEQSVVDDTHVALLFLDIDRFKLVNDTLGHSHGDELLVAVAERLQRHVRASDLVTRIGGDEFMIVLGGVVSVSHAVDMADRLRAVMRDPFVINGIEFDVTVSVGLAFASNDDPDSSVEVLVREADTAMHEAKESGRDSVALFDESMRTRLSERMELEHDLRHAVALGQFHLVYQPIVRVPHGPVEGVEALLRWKHPVHGVIPPVKFIPLAEESGLIVSIGDWVLDEAVRQLAEWRILGLPAPRYVSVNLSAAQLRDEGLVERVLRVLNRYEVDGSSLCLELTESMVMEDPDEAVRKLEQLRTLDINIAIDDFGTEYSSLAYLRRFPVTALKIDRTFVSNLDQRSSSDATLVEAIVAMAHALDIEAIAEGVETSSQADMLLRLGCDSVQGYYFSRPVAPGMIAELTESFGAETGPLTSST
ncbi:MAG TPA: EAL domain-containing protein [Acidimicrobiales bacterium]|nr:EAL domain-containing protein [Acidimicrobiales bacterium]